MATLTIRQLDDAVYARLKREAKANHRSVEAEVRYRLEREQPVDDGLALVARLRAAMVDPGPGYPGSVALIRDIRDEA